MRQLKVEQRQPSSKSSKKNKDGSKKYSAMVDNIMGFSSEEEEETKGDGDTK
jgi:hypothetical protein